MKANILDGCIQIIKYVKYKYHEREIVTAKAASHIMAQDLISGYSYLIQQRAGLPCVFKYNDKLCKKKTFDKCQSIMVLFKKYINKQKIV